uniref:Uncharacterized protein n=1 Tax=uncultured prokaryote TaxID=198431 RepID=A0A0H5Q3N4_9ZZZZ|nr:hypothetical protein [uncultured prokaryote]
MADIRFIVSWGPGQEIDKNWFSNTLYFAVDGFGADADVQGLADDLLAVYQQRSFTAGSSIEVRGYDMADPKPRPELGFARSTGTGIGLPTGPGQVALCLSYYSERNLPRQRGRIYCGPFSNPEIRPTSQTINSLITFGQALAGLGGLNVDWSVYSPTKASLAQDPTMTISNIWVDNSWDIIRSRKLDGTTRTSAEISG